METDFVSWLTGQMDQHSWTNSELARRAEVVPSTVSMILSRQKQAGLDFCIGVSRALHLPAETVLRKAGLLPARPEDSEITSELVYVFNQLGHEEQVRLLVQARALRDWSERERYTVREPTH
jgi:transcriptional regulator with XRE-family HTH domain